jgi:hypothetical protein
MQRWYMRRWRWWNAPAGWVILHSIGLWGRLWITRPFFAIWTRCYHYPDWRGRLAYFALRQTGCAGIRYWRRECIEETDREQVSE